MDLDDPIAREGIRELLARYGHAGDRRRLDEPVGCFHEEGGMELPLARIDGRRGISARRVRADAASGASRVLGCGR